MAKKATTQNNQPVNRPVAAPRQQQPTTKGARTDAGFVQRYLHIIVPAAIAVITWLFFKVCLDNQLTNWDDPGYIRDNALIKDVSAEGIKAIFSFKEPVMGNYHPLTILSYAIEYSYVRLDPWLYHLDSVLLHIVVTVLVYCFVQLLTKRMVAAAVTALLFGLHPMHVESVAWLAGRKDVVYGVFYVAACITHIYFIRNEGSKKWRWYSFTLLLFVCSLLGKPVAVVLPVTLLLIDYFDKRPLRWNLLIEKIPHFVLAIAAGIKSMQDQRVFGAIDTQGESFNAIERIGLGGYALVTYLWKALVPIKLCNFYPYPLKGTGSLNALYYVYPALLVAAALLLWKFARKNMAVVFGVLFFLVNIALLLQFIPVGGAIIADRYAYISYLGLFFMAGWFVSDYFEPGGNLQIGKMALGGVVVYALVLGYMSNERCKVWYDTTSLWRDEIEKEPVLAPNAWNNLGFNYFNKFNESANEADRKRYYDSAYFLLNKAIELQPDFANPHISLGELKRTVGKFDEAKVHYYKALSLKTVDESANAYLGLAIIYAISRNFDSSAICFNKALAIKPQFPEAHSNFGNFYDMTGKRDSALVHYGIAIAQNPDMFAPHLNRARLLLRMDRMDESMKDFDIALQLHPDDGEIYYSRSYWYSKKGNRAQALKDVEQGIKLGFTRIDNNYYQQLKAR